MSGQHQPLQSTHRLLGSSAPPKSNDASRLFAVRARLHTSGGKYDPKTHALVMAHGRNPPSVAFAKAVTDRQSRRSIQLHAVIQKNFRSSESRACNTSCRHHTPTCRHAALRQTRCGIRTRVRRRLRSIMCLLKKPQCASLRLQLCWYSSWEPHGIRRGRRRWCAGRRRRGVDVLFTYRTQSVKSHSLSAPSATCPSAHLHFCRFRGR